MGLTTWDNLGWQNLKNGTPGHISVARREFKNERNDLKRVVYCTRSSRSAVRKNRGNTYYYNGGIHRCKYVSGQAETRGFRMIKIYRWIYIYINYFYFAFTCLRAKTHGGRQEARAGRLRAKKKAKAHRHDKYIYIYIYIGTKTLYSVEYVMALISVYQSIVINFSPEAARGGRAEKITAALSACAYSRPSIIRNKT